METSLNRVSRVKLPIADLNLDEIREVRDGWQFFRDLRPDMYTDLTRTVASG